MTNVNYWKEAYKDLWDESSAKEEALKKFIKEETGLDMIPFGLGAESNEFIAGSAKDNNSEKGAPDYQINNTNIFIEVTGPLNKNTTPDKGLWIRPDKLEYAYNHLSEADEIFALYFPSVQEWFIIHATKEFFDDMEDARKTKHDYIIVNPSIRGRDEKYVEIKYKNKFIKNIRYLIEYLENYKKEC